MKLKNKHYKVNLENPIKKEKDDIFGYESEVKRIKNAIDKNANVIGIISEYGAGKSSLIELLKSKLKFYKYKVIKVNLWNEKLKESDNTGDNTSGKDDTNIIPTDKAIIKLHKTFLRQISAQTSKYDNTYINRRINANYGAAKISFPSYRSLFKWLTIYILIIVMFLLLTIKFGFNMNHFSEISLDNKINFINFIIPKIPTIIIGFSFFYIIFNKEILFSFWNNTKSREITEEDTIQIYNDLFKKCKLIPRLRKIIIVIEDLDRIEDDNLVEFYLNEFYRLYIEGNENNNNGITLIFCLKNSNKNSNDSKFVKIFDYISYINKINIDDKENILLHLVKSDNLLNDLTYDKNSRQNDISKLSWLIEGENINIRIIKRRIEQFKSIYLMIYSRGKYSNNNKLDINIIVCSFAAYLKTDYSKELDNLLCSYEDNLNFIDKYVNKKIIGERINKAQFAPKDTDTEDEKKVKKLKEIIIDTIDNGIIDDQYKKYFYNFPKGTKIYTTVEKEVADILNRNDSINEKNITKFNQLVEKVSESFLEEKLRGILLLGKNFPKAVLYDNKLLKVAKSINNKKLHDEIYNIISFNSDNDTNEYLMIVKESNINKKEFAIYIKSIVDENINNEEINLEDLYTFRRNLLKCFGIEICHFNNPYSNHQVIKEEIDELSSIDELICISKFVNYEESINELICEKFNKFNNDEKKKYIYEFLESFKDYKIIHKIDINYLSAKDRKNLYNFITKEIVKSDDKIELLFYLEYYDKNIAENLINDEIENESNMVEYMNISNANGPKCMNYILSRKKLYKISNLIYNSLEKDNEKYSAYTLLREKKLPESCDDETLVNIYLNYDEITKLLNIDMVDRLKSNYAYKKLNSSNITNDKILILTKVCQTKEMVKSIIESKNIPEEYKKLYIENIKELNKDAQKYIMFLLNVKTPKSILEAISNNKEIYYKNLSSKEKSKTTRIINELLR